MTNRLSSFNYFEVLILITLPSVSAVTRTTRTMLFGADGVPFKNDQILLGDGFGVGRVAVLNFGRHAIKFGKFL